MKLQGPTPVTCDRSKNNSGGFFIAETVGTTCHDLSFYKIFKLMTDSIILLMGGSDDIAL